jgi:hypothetical protein
MEWDLILGCVTGCLHDNDGQLMGRRHSNPLLDTCEYEVVFPDGSLTKYAAKKLDNSIRSLTTTPMDTWSQLTMHLSWINMAITTDVKRPMDGSY